jgi:uncharacterized protein YjbI with pentapeptide repeats
MTDETNFENTKMNGYRMINKNFKNASFGFSDFSEFEFENCEFNSCSLPNCNFRDATFKNVSFNDCAMSHCDFINIEGELLFFRGTQNCNSSFNEAKIKKSLLDGDFSFNDMRKITILESCLRGNFKMTDFSYSKFNYDVDLNNTSLLLTKFYTCNLRGTILDPINKPNGIINGLLTNGKDVIGYRPAENTDYINIASKQSKEFIKGRVYKTKIFSTSQNPIHPGIAFVESRKKLISLGGNIRMIKIKTDKNNVHFVKPFFRAKEIRVVE